jgi:hypothetical protein
MPLVFDPARVPDGCNFGRILDLALAEDIRRDIAILPIRRLGLPTTPQADRKDIQFGPDKRAFG